MFNELMDSVNDLCVDVFKTNREIIFTREGAEQLSLNAIFDVNHQNVDPESTAQIISSKMALSVKAKDLPDGVIHESDRIKIENRIYCIDEDVPDSEGMIKLFLLRVNS